MVTRLLNGELRFEPSLPSPTVTAPKHHVQLPCTVDTSSLVLDLSWGEGTELGMESVPR